MNQFVPPDPTSLSRRTDLPEALRQFADELPRKDWTGHPQFRGLAEFWLEKHLGFRHLVDHLVVELEAAADGDRDPAALRRTVSRFGSMLIRGLHDHHSIEDHHYFPILRDLEPRVVQGFDLLDNDHHALDPWMARVTEEANALIAAPGALRDESLRLLACLDEFGPFLIRHLTDEEDIVVPIILRSGLG